VVPEPRRGTAADVYTHGHHESVLRSHSWRTIANSAAYLEPHLRPDHRLLDVGCGPGTITVEFAERLTAGEVIGIDYGPDIIAKASADAAGSGLANLSFAVGDVYGLEFDDDSFDIVHAHQVLQHVSDPVAALREMRRVVKSDGIVAVRDADYHAMTWYPPDPVLDRWMSLYQAVARRNDAEPDAGRRLLAWSREAGFTAPEPTASVWCFADDASRVWWGTLWADRVVASSLGEQALAYGLASEGELNDIADAFRRWLASADAWFTVLNGEVLCRG